MPKHARRLKQSKSGSFHVTEDFGKSWLARHNRKKMGPLRTLFTSASLLLGLGSAFVALHYVPAFMSPTQVLRATDLDRDAMAQRRDGVMKYIGPYWDSLQTRRSFIWEGESVEVRYVVPQGQTAELTISRCARQLVLEIFNCKVVGQQVVQVGSRGKSRFQIAEPGFYRFAETGSPDAQVLWRRL